MDEATMITDEQYAAASLAGEEEHRAYAAVRAKYDKRSHRIMIELASGVVVAVPVSILQGLTKASDDDLKSLYLDDDGIGLHITSLDWDMSVPGIMQGRYGSPKWMKALHSQKPH